MDGPNFVDDLVPAQHPQRVPGFLPAEMINLQEK